MAYTRRRKKRTTRRKSSPKTYYVSSTPRRRSRRRGLSAGGMKGALTFAAKAGAGGLIGSGVIGILRSSVPQVGTGPIAPGLVAFASVIVATKMKQPVIAAGMAAVAVPALLKAAFPNLPLGQGGQGMYMTRGALAQNGKYALSYGYGN